MKGNPRCSAASLPLRLSDENKWPLLNLTNKSGANRINPNVIRLFPVALIISESMFEKRAANQFRESSQSILSIY